MPDRNTARLAIHRRSDEMAFLQQRLRALQTQDKALETALQDRRAHQRDSSKEVVARERDLADELVHTRHTEPLGETLQRRLAMAERICRDLAETGSDAEGNLSKARWIAEIERQALTEMLKQWWAWLHEL
jgi:seryl-tRNA synthetase